jgi:hypothetical protein
MGYVLLGHGWLELEPGVIPKGMEYVAVPQGTTIKFYSDSGRGLVYGSAKLDFSEQLTAPWPPIDSSRVAYNLVLHGAEDLGAEGLPRDPQFGGHLVVRPGVDGVADPLLLCSGSRRTCPTDPRQVAAGATHQCDGILGALSGELYWLGCTSIESADRAVTVPAPGGRPSGVVLGEDPDWLPGEADQEAIAEVNGANVKDTDDRARVAFVLGGLSILIGDGHASRHVDYVAGQDDTVAGMVKVYKAGVFDPGTLEFSDVPIGKQGVVASAVRRFSKKKVEFG